MVFKLTTILLTGFLICYSATAQVANNFFIQEYFLADSTPVTQKLLPKHNHRIATKRSAIIPGWGQAYNKEYWKIPIVYGALAIPTVTFIYNNTWYKRTKTAYELLFRASQPNATQDDIDAYQQNTDERLKGFSLGSLQTFRNAFRRDRDMSVLWFVVVWGLNVVDATVFGHLKEFNVSDDLSMQINPMVNPLNNSTGISVVLALKNNTTKKRVVVR